MRKRVAAMAIAGTALLSTTLTVAPAQAFGSYGIAIYIADGYCLDIPNSNPYNGAVVQQYWCNGTNAQQWNLFDSGSHYFKIQSSAWPQYCLNNWSSGDINGSYIKLYNCNSDDDNFNTVGVDQSNYWEFQPFRASANCANMWTAGSAPAAGDVMRLSPCWPHPNALFRLS